MNLSQAIFKVNSIYSKVKRYIFSFLEKKQLTQKQLNDLTTKIDLVWWWSNRPVLNLAGTVNLVKPNDDSY